jgi:hypothetical protein
MKRAAVVVVAVFLVAVDGAAVVRVRREIDSKTEKDLEPSDRSENYSYNPHVEKTQQLHNHTYVFWALNRYILPTYMHISQSIHKVHSNKQCILKPDCYSPVSKRRDFELKVRL